MTGLAPAGPVPRLALAASVLLAARPCVAQPSLGANVSVSTAAVKTKPQPITLKFGYQRPATSRGRPAIGISVGMEDGKRLETLLWSGGGAVAGSLAGPLGAIVGAATGAVVGFLIGVYVVPHNGDPKPAPGPAKR